MTTSHKSSSVTLEPVPASDKPVLEALMQLYLYDSSGYTDDLVNEQGLFEYAYLNLYWTENGRFPFLIRCYDSIAGLALVRTLEFGADPLYQMAEFFILLTHRRLGIGKLAATMLFDEFPGRWEVQQDEYNEDGVRFWKKVIRAYTRRDYREEVREAGEKCFLVQMFRSRSQPLAE